MNESEKRLITPNFVTKFCEHGGCDAALLAGLGATPEGKAVPCSGCSNSVTAFKNEEGVVYAKSAYQFCGQTSDSKLRNG